MHVATTAAQPVKFGKAGFVAGNGLPIEQARSDFKRAHRLEDEREAFGPVVPVAGEKPHSGDAAARKEPKAIMLDFVDPLAASRRPLDGARPARLAEVGKGTQTPQHGAINAARRAAGVESNVPGGG
jgi:hypothetical protein